MARPSKHAYIWWYVLLVGLGLQAAYALVAPFAEHWRSLIGSRLYTNLWVSLTSLANGAISAGLIMVYLAFRSRLFGAVRWTVPVALALLAATCVVELLLAARMLLNVGLTNKSTVNQVLAMVLPLMIALGVIAKFLSAVSLICFARVAQRFAPSPRALPTLLLVLGLLIAAASLQALPQAWRFLENSLGLPAWTQPPRWLERHYLLGFKNARLVWIAEAVLQFALVLAIAIFSGALKNRGIFAPRGRCQHCLYDLTGIPQINVCPECGTSIPAQCRTEA